MKPLLPKPKAVLSQFHEFEHAHSTSTQQINLLPNNESSSGKGWGLDVHRGPSLSCRPKGESAGRKVSEEAEEGKDAES